MATSYFSNLKSLRRKSKQATSPANLEPTITTPSEEPAKSPVLDEEDEKFLERLAAIASGPDSTPPPLPERPAVVLLDNGEKKVSKDAQAALMDGAEKVPLPMSPPEVNVEDTEKFAEDLRAEERREETEKKRKSVLGYFALAGSKFKRGASDKGKDGDKTKDEKAAEKKEAKENKGKGKEKATDKDLEKAADTLAGVAEHAKSAQEKETEKETQDLTEILDQLNLSAVNNRVFSFSKESQELLDKFKLVLKDIVNGAPTAYNDLEKLLTDSEGQLKKMYGSLPPFLQNLVKSLPTKISAALGPEILAAQAEKPGFDAKQSGKFGKRSRKPKVPSLKSLVSAEGAVATMLRSILNFLKLRFPAVMTGTNVLMSLAVFLLLFVFWYCHKRGRETRLEKERLAAEEADSAMASSASSTFDTDNESKPSSSKQSTKGNKEKVEPPLIIKDGKEEVGEASAAVQDLPSVSHLPEPKDKEAPASSKEDAVKMPPASE